MRPIIFRAKSSFNMEWEYGYLGKDHNGDLVLYLEDDLWGYSGIHERTIGQFTGLNALDGTPIYEGDIVLISPFHDNKLIGEVVYEDGCFLLDGVEGNDILCNYEVTTVLGNIHDNPELIKKGGK